MTFTSLIVYIRAMNISLTPKLESFVKETVEAGLYNNASEVMREALRLLREKEIKRQELYKALDAGYEDVKAGRTTPFSRELMDEISDKVSKKFK